MQAKDCLNLIQLVQDNPCIWDRSHPLHNCANHVKAVWADIAEKVDSSVDKAKAKWKNLRDCYRFQLYKKIDAIERGDPKAADMIWPYYVEMSFLQDHMYRKATPAKTRAQMKAENTLDQPINITSTKNIEMVTVDDFDQSVLEYLDESASNASRRNKHPINVNINGARLSTEPVEDEDRCFFDSLLPYMKLLSPKDKMLCRMKIQETVFGIAFPPGKDGNSSESGK
ncbi:transcription factor Adf-1-like [Planococcus citri]|uniref:transcription factor Adf-1-like n=1 Tax=Planococcus citri TaxID=170843 RepID=UPI0031F9B359